MYYDFDRIKMYIIGIGVVSAVLLSFWYQSENKKFEKDIENISGGIKWTQEGMENAVREYESALSAVQATLDRHDYREASKMYSGAESKMESWSSAHGTRKLTSGETLFAWHQARIKDFNSVALIKAADDLIAYLKTGEGSDSDVSTMRHGFHGAYSRLIDQRFRENSQDIDEARAKLAGNWVRVVIGATYQVYEEPARNAFREGWDTGSKYKLVFGQPLGNMERVATLKTLRLFIQESSSRYGFEGKEKDRGSAELPDGLKVTFTVETGRDASSVKSSWDHIKPLEINEPFPQEYLFKFKNERQKAGFESLITERRDVLVQKLVESVKGLPAFKVIE